jgi:hypothetical protein
MKDYIGTGDESRDEVTNRPIQENTRKWNV